MQGQLAVCVTPQKDDPGWGVVISGITALQNSICERGESRLVFLSRPRGLKLIQETTPARLSIVYPDANETTAPGVEAHQQGQHRLPEVPWTFIGVTYVRHLRMGPKPAVCCSQ